MLFAAGGGFSRENYPGNNSISLDKLVLDYYPEYQMLKQLKDLTSDFNCTKCQ